MESEITTKKVVIGLTVNAIHIDRYLSIIDNGYKKDSFENSDDNSVYLINLNKYLSEFNIQIDAINDKKYVIYDIRKRYDIKLNKISIFDAKILNVEYAIKLNLYKFSLGYDLNKDLNTDQIRILFNTISDGLSNHLKIVIFFL
jgi:hypothetical protein